MPRNPGTGIYTKPAPDVVTGTTVESKVYNDFVNDVEFDLNAKRPIIAGGTGADDAAEARDNLDAERAGQQVADYSTHVWELGSFYSLSSATAPPAGLAHAFAGIVYGVIDATTPANSKLVIEARDLDDATTPGLVYAREKIGTAAWSAWSLADSGAYVLKAGDTMTGALTVTPKGSMLGAHGGTPATGSVVQADANLLLYNVGSGNWSGMGVDSDGIFWVRTGTSGTPSPALRIAPDKKVDITGVLAVAGAATFSSNLTVGALATLANLTVSTGGSKLGAGLLGREAMAGAYGTNYHNFLYSGPIGTYVDNTYIGNITITSDYRTKKDVKDLSGTWDIVKSLRPISYTVADWTPAWELETQAKRAAEKGEQVTPFHVGDDLERWGFIAHELQDTLLPTAATGHKDAEGIIQSPNLMPLIAALTKALQEAMARIEALETAQAPP